MENLGKLFFFATQGEDGKPVLKPLGGFPKGAVINLGGTSDTGKSLLAEQFTVENALSRRVVFVTTESPKENLIASIKRISLVRGIPLEEIENKVIIVDLSKGANLDYRSILPRLSLLIEKAKAEILVIDSLTAFFEDREMMARSVTRAIYRFAKERKLTTLLISQKREDSPFSARTAGGLAIGHIVDCNIVLSKLVITTPYERNLYGKEIGEVVRTLRIDGCRMCGHSSRTFIIEIDRYGILKVVGPLGKRVQRD